MWTVIAIVILTLVGVFVILALALVVPARVGVALRVEDRLSEATGGFRLYGGLLGVGAQMRRGSTAKPLPTTVTVGVLLWRSYWPLRQVYPTAEPAAPSAPDEPGFGPPEGVSLQDATARDRPREEEFRWEAAEATEPASRRPSSTRPPDRGPKAPLRTSLRAVRAVWGEWSPIVKAVLRRLRGVLKLCHCHIEGTFGAADPALTGQVVGVASAMRGFEGRRLRIRIAPDFDRRTVQGVARIEWRVSLLRIWSAGLYVGWILFRRWRMERRRATHASATHHEEDQPSKP